jgi:hypothetical protein
MQASSIMPSPENRMGACSLGQEGSSPIPSTGVAAGILQTSYAPITVDGSTVTPGPCVDEIAIFFR